MKEAIKANVELKNNQADLKVKLSNYEEEIGFLDNCVKDTKRAQERIRQSMMAIQYSFVQFSAERHLRAGEFEQVQQKKIELMAYAII